MKLIFKKFTAVFIALVMMFSVITATTVNAVENRKDTNIYYSFPYYLGITPGLAYDTVYCHIYALNDSDPDFVSHPYMSNAEKCTYNTQAKAYSYDLAANFTNTPLKDDAEYAVIFTVTADEDMFITSPLKLTTSCMSDTAFSVNDTTLAPSDSTKAVYTTYWSDKSNFKNNKPLELEKNDTNIYVEYPDFLFDKYRFYPESITTYCHIEAVDDPDFVPFSYKATNETCVVINRNLISFNVGKLLNSSLKEGKTYTVTFAFDPSGPISDVTTYPLTMGTECIGDTIYLVNNFDGEPWEATSDEYMAYWTKEANAEKYSPVVPEKDTNIYYQIPDFYTEKFGVIPGVATVSCHVYALNGTDPDFKGYNYMSKAEQCTYNEETGLYSFDLAEKFADTPLKDNAVYGVTFIVAPSGPYPNIISADLTMTTDCMGDTVYTVDNTDSSPQDSPSGTYNIYWTENSRYCPVKNLGDLNNDNDISILDATYTQMIVSKLNIDADINLAYADMNFDGNIAINDATTIQMKIAKFI